MKRENRQAKFDALVGLVLKLGRDKRKSVLAKLNAMIVEDPALADLARLFGLDHVSGLTREMPWLAPTPASRP